MKALLIIDAQNEFSPMGKRSVDGFYEAVTAIAFNVHQARVSGMPIAWIRHHNKPSESPAFVPNSWGAEYIKGLAPDKNADLEIEFVKDVYGAFTGTTIDEWLKRHAITDIVLTGFYTHGCVSTTAREGIMKGYRVFIDPAATATIAISEAELGTMTARELKKAALLHLCDMGAQMNRTELNEQMIWEQFKEDLIAYYESMVPVV